MYGTLEEVAAVEVPRAGSRESPVPRVTIGLPVYNGERYLRIALDSILGQTFDDFELCISDNASTDATEEICREYARNDHRILYERQEQNQGGAWNFNHVVTLARGEYFKWASHDDVLAPTFLEKCVAALDADPAVVLSFPLTVKINDRGDSVIRIKVKLRTDAAQPWLRFEDLMRVPHGYYQGSGLIRTAILRESPRLGPYVESDRILLAWLSLVGRFYEVPEYLFFSRGHAGQSVRQSRFARAVWFDPSSVDKVLFPMWRLFSEYARCIRAVPLRSADRSRCYLDVLRWPMWNGNWLWMAGDVRRALMIGIRGQRPARPRVAHSPDRA